MISKVSILINTLFDKLSLARDKSMTEMDLKQPGFTQNDCGPFTKYKKKLKM